MVASLRITFENFRASLTQLVDWLLGFDVGSEAKRPAFDGSEIARYLSDVERKRQALADGYEESGTIGLVRPNLVKSNPASGTPDTPRGNRTISYWSNSGHFWQFKYNEQTIMDTDHHINNLADDPTIPFSHDDAMRCQRIMQLMEATMDCRDVVGF